MAVLIALFCALLLSARQGNSARLNPQKGKAPGAYGYYEVREAAHTFWWLLPATGESKEKPLRKPIVLWLQGGPGASGSGFGNFEEIGPFSIGWRPRKHSWAEKANLLFVDSPVGSGFSYVTCNSSYATKDSTVANDLLAFLRHFLDDHDAHDHPLYIFAESYGGKTLALFAQELLTQQKMDGIKVNLRGVAFGDSWISPLDYVLTWPDFLKAWSLMDDFQISQLAPLLLDTQEAVKEGNLRNATHLWGRIEEAVGNLTDNVDWYNALMHNIPDLEAASLWLQAQPHISFAISRTASGDDIFGKSCYPFQGMNTVFKGEPGNAAGKRLLQKHHQDPLTKFMRHDVTKRLGIIPDEVQWGAQSQEVFDHLDHDFMVDALAAVDAVLDSGMSVAIYHGQLDLICSTLGLDAWLPNLQWKGLDHIQAAKPVPIYAFGPKGGKTTGFIRQHDNLAIFNVLNAGHMVPSDQPEVSLDMLEKILSR